MLKSILVMMMMAVCTQVAVAGQEGVEGVIGVDTRKQITFDNDQTVHNSIGLLEIRFGTSVYMCTGTAVGPRHVLTAAHCLWEKGKLPDGVVFYPGAKNNPAKVAPPYGKFYAKTVKVYGNYRYDQSEKSDLGMIITEKALPVKALPIAQSPSWLALPFYELSIAGYPGDKSYGTLWESKGYISPMMVLTTSNAHDLDTMPGMSGSTVRIGSQVIGVHSAGVMGYNGQYVNNLAHFFTATTYSVVMKWLSE